MPWYESFDKEIAARLPELEVLREAPMAEHTTFRVGGPARRLARPVNAEELAALLDLAQKRGWPWMTLGNGSNLLIADEGVDRLVVHTGRLDLLERSGERTIRAGAGVSLARLAVFAQKAGLAGLAFAHGIPGSLGGAVCMNAGAYGGEMCQAVRSVSAWLPDSGVVHLTAEKLDFSYRHSVFSAVSGVVLEAELLLTPADPNAIRAEMEELIRRRREKQPLEYPSAGSTFKRPPGRFAGGLIEQCGLKGIGVGGAQVSEKHAGFIINTGGATCADVLGLIALVRDTVREQTGVELEPEVKIIR